MFDGASQKKKKKSRVLGEGLMGNKEAVLAAELEVYW